MDYVWPKPFLVDLWHVKDQYGGRMAPAGRANGAASRLSRPGPDPALPAPRPSPPTMLVRTLGKQACTCRATTCLCARARGSPDLLGEFSRQMQIWLSNAIRGPGLVTLAKQPGQPTCHALFCRGTPFSPAPAACHCEVPWQILTAGPISAGALITKGIARIAPSMALMNSHRTAVPSSPASGPSWPRLRHRSACSLTHAPHSTARRARFGPCPVSGLYLGSSAFSRCSRPPGGPHYSCWNVV